MIRGEKRPPAMSAAGQKKGIFGRVRAKTGRRSDGFDSPLDITVEHSDRVSAGPIDVMSLGMKPFVAIPDPIDRSKSCPTAYHEFVIDSWRRNKLKKRPK
jgi:hypothetical protein